MQKLINVVALLSGLTSAALIGGAGYVLLNKDALIEQAKSAAAKAATEAVAGALPGMLDSAMPEVPALPSTTGPVLPMP